jgi:hypothetical protein
VNNPEKHELKRLESIDAVLGCQSDDQTHDCCKFPSRAGPIANKIPDGQMAARYGIEF